MKNLQAKYFTSENIPIYGTCIYKCGNAYTTKEQEKTRLASTVQTGVQPVSSVAALEVLIGEVTVSVATANLQSSTVSLVVLKAASCFLDHHEQGAPDTFVPSHFSVAPCTFNRYCNTSTATYAYAYAGKCVLISLDTINANNFCVF